MRVAQVDPPVCRRLIEEDLICGSCGYNLRGQTLDARCPECGMPVSRSARHDLLRYSDRSWLKGVVAGFVPFMLCAALALVFRVAYSLGVHTIINSGTNAAQMEAYFEALQWSSVVSMIVVQSSMLIGTWMITAREPNKVLEPMWLRPLARRCMLAVFVISLALSIPWLAFQTTGIRFFPGQTIMVTFKVVGGACLLIAIASLFILARRLAFRIPDEQLARRTAIAAVGIIAIMLFEAVYSWTNFFGFFFTISGEASRYLRHLPQAIVTVWAIVLLVQYRTRILAVQ